MCYTCFILVVFLTCILTVTMVGLFLSAYFSGPQRHAVNCVFNAAVILIFMVVL